MAFVTKSKGYGLLFGSGLSEFDPNVKPTYCNVVQFWIWHYDKARGTSRIMSQKNKENVVKNVVENLMALPVYNQPSVNLMSEKVIRNKVDYLINTKIGKMDLRRRNSDSEENRQWIKDTKKEFEEIFDIEVSHSPESVNLLSPKRKIQELCTSSDSDMEYMDNANDQDYSYLLEQGQGGEHSRIPEELERAVEIGIQHKISSEVLGKIINAVLLAIVPEREHLNVSPGGIDKVRERVGKKAVAKQKEEDKNLICLKFDGKSGPVALPHNKFVREHIVTVVKEGRGQSGYVSHYKTKGETGLVIGSGLHDILEDTDSKESIVALGSDNAPNNTGPKSGAMTFVEIQLERPLQHIVCMYHMAELPIKYFYEELDGRANGPIGPNGPIGQAIRALNDNLTPIVNFNPIATNIPNIPDDLVKDKHDMQMVRDLCNGISTGQIDAKYENKERITIGWAQWRTTQIAIMLYYIREQNPSENLIKIVTYSTQAWAPTVFGIMIHPQFEYTSFHYMNYIIWSKEALSLEDWDGIVKKDFIVNSHPAHPETILYCAIACPLSTPDTKQRALHLIMDARKRKKKSRATKVRKFRYPGALVNFEAETIMDLLDWDTLPKSYITSPPLLEKFSDEDLILFVKGKKDLEFEDLKSHSQDCERAVKHTSEALLRSLGFENQQANIIVTEQSRAKMPLKYTKQDLSQQKLNFYHMA